MTQRIEGAASSRLTADELADWWRADERRRRERPDGLRWVRAYLADPAGNDERCVVCGRAADQGAVIAFGDREDERLTPHELRGQLAGLTLTPAGLVVPVCEAHGRLRAALWPPRVRIAVYDHLLALRVASARAPRQLGPGGEVGEAVEGAPGGEVVVRAHDCPGCRCEPVPLSLRDSL